MLTFFFRRGSKAAIKTGRIVTAAVASAMNIHHTYANVIELPLFCAPETVYERYKSLTELLFSCDSYKRDDEASKFLIRYLSIRRYSIKEVMG